MVVMSDSPVYPSREPNSVAGSRNDFPQIWSLVLIAEDILILSSTLRSIWGSYSTAGGTLDRFPHRRKIPKKRWIGNPLPDNMLTTLDDESCQVQNYIIYKISQNLLNSGSFVAEINNPLNYVWNVFHCNKMNELKTSVYLLFIVRNSLYPELTWIWPYFFFVWNFIRVQVKVYNSWKLTCQIP